MKVHRKEIKAFIIQFIFQMEYTYEYNFLLHEIAFSVLNFTR